MYHKGRGGRATSKLGGGGVDQHKWALSRKKGAPTTGNSKRKYTFFLDIGIYPYIVITLSGMISIFVSLSTPNKILLCALV